VDDTGSPERSHSGRFWTTRWSLVAEAAGSATQARDALAELYEAYWYPVYAFARSRGTDAETAADQTQGFFVSLIERQALRRFDPARGRFRSFLLASFKNYAANSHRFEVAAKRGGGVSMVALDGDQAQARYAVEPRHADTPERVFERAWAVSQIEQALARLRAERAQVGQEQAFVALRPYLTETATPRYAAAAASLQMSEGAVKMAVHRLRRRFGQLLREVVGETVARDQVDTELHELLSILTEQPR